MSIGDVLPEILTECGIDVASPDISSNDFQMKQLANLVNVAGRDINERVEWAGATASLPVPATSASIALPSDFQEMAEHGAVTLDGGAYTPVRPVLAPAMWQMLKAGASAQPYYHIDSGAINFSPVIPTGGATVRYISKNWLGTKDAVTDNADEPVFPSGLLARGVIWRWKRQKGLPFDDLLAEYEADIEAAIKADRGAA